jgi:hypothetical protein
MRMAPRAAAWVAWAVWTCNTTHCGRGPAMTGYGQKRAGFGPLFFLVVRPAGRTHLEVKALYTAAEAVVGDGAEGPNNEAESPDDSARQR